MSEGALVLCKGVRDLRAHQNNLRRIINPYQDDDDRGCGPICGLQSLLAYVKSNRGFPELKQHSSSHRPKPNIVPINSHVRKPLEHHRKQQRGNVDGSQHGDEMKQPLLHMRCGIFTESLWRGLINAVPSVVNRIDACPLSREKQRWRLGTDDVALWHEMDMATVASDCRWRPLPVEKRALGTPKLHAPRKWFDALRTGRRE